MIALKREIVNVLHMRQNYNLEWLDLLKSLTLNPDKTDLSSISDSQIEGIMLQLALEKDKVKSLLKN